MMDMMAKMADLHMDPPLLGANPDRVCFSAEVLESDASSDVGNNVINIDDSGSSESESESDARVSYS